MTFFEWFYKVVIVQGICVILVLLSVILARYFMPEIFAEMKNFYTKNLTPDTSISEVLNDEI